MLECTCQRLTAMVTGTDALATYYVPGSRLYFIGTVASRWNPIINLLSQWRKLRLREMIQVNLPDVNAASNRNAIPVKARLLTVPSKHLCISRQTSGTVDSKVGWGSALKRALSTIEMVLDFTAIKWHKMKGQFHDSGSHGMLSSRGMCLEEVNLVMV